MKLNSYILLLCVSSTQMTARSMASAEAWTTKTLERLAAARGDAASVVDAIMSYTQRGNPTQISSEEVDGLCERLGWSRARFLEALELAVRDGWLGSMQCSGEFISLELVALK